MVICFYAHVWSPRNVKEIFHISVDA